MPFILPSGDDLVSANLTLHQFQQQKYENRCVHGEYQLISDKKKTPGFTK